MISDRHKCRAWTDNEVYIYDVMPINPQVFWTIDYTKGTLIEEHWVEADYEQCTGLKDKNGRLIYEGDIVRVISYPKVVTWVDARWRLINKRGSCTDIAFSECLEVIGNIHENPELLEVGDE